MVILNACTHPLHGFHHRTIFWFLKASMQYAILSVPAFKNTTKIQREDPQRGTKRANMVPGEGKKSEILGGPADLVRRRAVPWRRVRAGVPCKGSGGGGSSQGGSRGGGPTEGGRAEDGPGERVSGAPVNKRNHHTLTSEKWPEQRNLLLHRQNQDFKNLKCYFKIFKNNFKIKF